LVDPIVFFVWLEPIPFDAFDAAELGDVAKLLLATFVVTDVIVENVALALV
jgi:hypothetical protein